MVLEDANHEKGLAKAPKSNSGTLLSVDFSSLIACRKGLKQENAGRPGITWQYRGVRDWHGNTKSILEILVPAAFVGREQWNIV